MIGRKRWSSDEDRVVLQYVQATPVLSDAFDKAAQELGRSKHAVHVRYYKRLRDLSSEEKQALKQDIEDTANRHGRPVPCEEIDGIAEKHGVSPIRVNACWGNMCRTNGGGKPAHDLEPVTSVLVPVLSDLLVAKVKKVSLNLDSTSVVFERVRDGMRVTVSRLS